MAMGSEPLAGSGFDAAAAADDAQVAQAYAYLQGGQLDQLMQMLPPLARAGNARAQFLLGELYARGEGVTQDDEQAARWWRQAADQGLAFAQNELGVVLMDGRGVQADPLQALAWYRRAADQGLGVAQVNIGLVYFNGVESIPRDDRQAVAWFQKAAGQGLGWAQFYLGVACYNGRGVVKNLQQAFAWFQKAADQGYTEAQYSLGAMYARGEGKLRDNGRAIEWFARAAQNGHEQAEQSLRQLVRGLTRTRLPAGTGIREQADTTASILQTLTRREFARVLNRGSNWIEVYLEDSHVVGYVSAQDLRR
jgi:TPR repeat protein